MFVPGQAPAWVSAGDSRIYLHASNALRPLTVDDTIAGQLNRGGRVPPEHSKILQFVGMGKNFEPHVGEVADVLEEQLLLTTDGVHYLEDGSDWFKNVIQHAPEAGAAAKRLIDVAKRCEGPDNATVAVVEFPVQLSEYLSVDSDLQMWDAFGELHIQLQHAPSQIQFEASEVSKKGFTSTQERDEIKDHNEGQLPEPKSTPTPKRKPSRKKAASKAEPVEGKSQLSRQPPNWILNFPQIQKINFDAFT